MRFWKREKGGHRGSTSLRKQMVLTVAGVFILTLIVTVAAGILSGKYAIDKNVEDDMQSIGAMADVTLSGKISEVKQNAEAMADLYDAELHKGSADPMSEVTRVMDNYQFKEIASVDQKGNASSSASFLQGDLSGQECIQRALKGETVLTTSQQVSDSEIRFFVATPTSAGCLVATLDGQYFSDIIKGVVVGKTGNVFMIDNTGVMIANKRPELVSGRQNFIEMAKTDTSYTAAAAVYTRMKNGESGVDRYSYETGTRICAFAPVSGSDGWSYGVVAPVKEMNARIVDIVAALVVCSLVAMAVGLILINRYAARLSRPIQKITGGMEQLSRGDLSIEMETVDRRDEIGALSRSFYETVAALKSYIMDIENVLHEVSEGHLHVKSQVEFKGEFVKIQNSLETILSFLNNIFRDIIDTSQQVTNSAQQFAAGAQTLSQGATEQASSVEELAATISEISGQVSDSAKGADEANRHIQIVGSEAEESNRRMQEMLEAMGQIKDTSGQINKIIKTIEDIAFQTNILALNAAVEAARAGSAGKGFAVVADEVRNLAGKSAEASRNTAALIENALSAVRNGTGIADQTAQSLTKVVSGVEEVAEITGKITEATERQAEATAQVNAGIEQISGVVQTNSATAEESAATSQELLRGAESLLSKVKGLKLR